MELRYKIKEIPEGGRTIDLPLAVDLLQEALEGLEPDLAQSSGSIRFTLTRARRDVVVSGQVSAMLTVACSACLKPAGLTVRVPLNAVYVEGDEDAVVAEEKEEDDLEAADVLHHDGSEIDLRPLIREQLILSLPMSPRCKEDCKGLCPVCGEDKNLRECGHRVELPAEDLRFAALKSLKVQ